MLCCHDGKDSIFGRLLPISTPGDSRTGSPAFSLALPKPIHKWVQPHGIISVAASPKRQLLFCGTQDSKILVFDLVDYQLRHEISVENTLVLCLDLSLDERFLFSAGSDLLVKVWDVDDYSCRFIIYSLADIGDIFSIKWCDKDSIIFVGAQNASLSWTKLNLENADRAHTTISKLPDFRYDKFFDSKGPGGLINTLQTKHNLRRKDSTLKKFPGLVEIDNQVRFAHNGYIYCMEFYEHTLVTCGGDGLVKVWDTTMNVVFTLDNDISVLSMYIQGLYLYVGLCNGTINVWDLLTQQLIRSYSFQDEEITGIVVNGDYVYKVLNRGLMKFGIHSSESFQLSENEPVLTTRAFTSGNRKFLISGGPVTSIWEISLEKRPLVLLKPGITNEDMLSLLAQLVRCKTVSKYPQLYLEESRKCAQYLIKLLTELGSYQTKLLPVENANPVVSAQFKASENYTDPPRVIWYGHYDVVDAGDGWNTEPFEMLSFNGNIYGRGVSDNKGPTLAAIYAVAELAASGKLACDVVFLIEGEEECGLYGFQQVINKNKDMIGDIDWVMLLNSYWLDDVTPCLNYGLRGMVNALITVKSVKPDRHSGVDGGVSREPTMDLIQVVSNLIDPQTQKINIPGFYDLLLPLTEKELQLYKKIEQTGIVDQDLQTLMAKWRNPSLTVHKIQVSGPKNNTVIPQSATASVSIRVVPNQELDVIKTGLQELLKERFALLQLENQLAADVYYTAEPWLGNPFNHVYKVLAENIEAHWGTKPLYIREGGSIPSIRFLEKCFNAPAAQIPCGQASDNAHLKDEKLRVVNLYKLRAILSDTFSQLKRGE